MSDAANFAKMVPGFDFLQGLVKNAGSALPNIGQWVAPTLNPEELEKRIEELRTVQFWLEQNARMLGATIQALEVQRMTLSTLKTMNVQMSDLRESLKLPVPGESPPEAAAPAAAGAPKRSAGKAAAAPATPPPGVVDPMQWWGALTKQFTQLAAGAMKDGPSAHAKDLAGAMVKQSFDAAEKTLQSVVRTPTKSAGGGAKMPAKKTAAKRKRSAGA